MEAVTTFDQIVAYVGAHNAVAKCLIGVDGFDGTGKTTLAFQLAAQLNGIRVGLDCYVAKERSGGQLR